MLTMEEIRKQNYKIFNSLGDGERVKQEHSLKYIEQLGLQTGTDVSKWKVLGIFGEDGQLPIKKNDINVMFFKHLKTNKQEKKAPKIPEKIGVEDLNDIFQKGFAQASSKSIKGIERSIKQTSSRIKDLNRSLVHSEKEIEQSNKTLLAIKEKMKTKIDLEPQVKQILADGFWTLSQAPSKGHLSFVSPEIRLSFKRDKQNALLMVNMGIYQVNIAPHQDEGLNLLVRPYDKNPKWDGLHHPHIDQCGTVCFGDQTDRSWNASREYNLVETLRILKDVICDYNQDSAYVQLSRFQEAIEKGYVFDREKWLKSVAEIREVLLANRITDPVENRDEESEDDEEDHEEEYEDEPDVM